jgi:hypothetical protein
MAFSKCLMFWSLISVRIPPHRIVKICQLVRTQLLYALLHVPEKTWSSSLSSMDRLHTDTIPRTDPTHESHWSLCSQ